MFVHVLVIIADKRACDRRASVSGARIETLVTQSYHSRVP